MVTFLFFIGIIFSSTVLANGYEPLDGDIIFHTSTSSQSKAIQLATNSLYSHVGLVMKREGKGYEVFEAENKVEFTLLDDWVKRGVDQKYVVKRLKKSLSSQQIAAMKTNIVLKWVGKPYDKYFDWNHGSLYCSELVWVVFADPKINIRLSELRRLDSFNVTNVDVHNLLVKRYKNKIPFAMEVVAPADIFNSPQLIEVYKN